MERHDTCDLFQKHHIIERHDNYEMSPYIYNINGIDIDIVGVSGLVSISNKWIYYHIGYFVGMPDKSIKNQWDNETIPNIIGIS